MSVVTNAVLSAKYMSAMTQAELEKRDWVNVGRRAGGSKVFEADTFAKAFNHTSVEQIMAELSEFISHVASGVLVIHDDCDDADEMLRPNVWRVVAWGHPARFHGVTQWEEDRGDR